MDKIPKKEKKVQAEIIGIDIGSEGIKLVRGVKEEDKIIVSHFALKKIPAADKEPAALINSLKELLRECAVEEKKIKRIKVHTVIPGSKVCVRAVRLPYLPKEEIPQAVKAKTKEFVSYPLDEMVFDYSLLGTVEEKGIKKQQVVFIAIQKKDLYRHLDILKGAGIEPDVVTAPCFCGGNLMKATGITGVIPSSILISIGYLETDITVLRRGELTFTRNIPFGNRNFIETIKNELSLKWEEAQDIVQKFGLSAEMIAGQYKFLPAQLQEILTRQAQVLFKEIELTAHHYHQITHGESIDKYILFGGGAKIKGLAEFLTQKLDSPLEKMAISQERIDVVSESKERFRQEALLYYQSLGAMFVAATEINLISFLRPKIKRGLPLARLTLAPTLAHNLIFVFLALAVIIFIFLKGQNIYYSYRIKQHQAMWLNLKARLDSIAKLQGQLEYLEFKKGLYTRLSEQGIFYPEIILSICEQTPAQEMFLEELLFSGQPDGKATVTIAGRNFLNARISPSDFLLDLEKTGYFENLSLTTSERPSRAKEGVREEAASFNIKGQIRRER